MEEARDISEQLKTQRLVKRAMDTGESGRGLGKSLELFSKAWELFFPKSKVDEVYERLIEQRTEKKFSEKFKQAKEHLDNEEYVQAWRLFEKILEKSPEEEFFLRSATYLYLGHICHNMGNLKESLPFYEKATELNPTDYLYFNYTDIQSKIAIEGLKELGADISF